MSTGRVYRSYPTFARNFLEITKARLAMSVVFSSAAGYLLGATTVDYVTLLMLVIGGYCLVGASNAYNQIVETDLDALMTRTQNRPLPSGRMGKTEAFIIASVLCLAGLVLLYLINEMTAIFGAISVFLYVSLYTPLKTKTPLAVFVGAFPGAIPFLLGWVGATGDFGIEAGTLFMIQFFWQFPHFWAIGWFLHEDYQKGGFKMLPSGKRDKKTATQVVLYTVWTVIASLIPVLGVTGTLSLSIPAAFAIGSLGIGLLYFAVKLYQEMTDKAARILMLASVSYITLLQIIFVIDKFLR